MYIYNFLLHKCYTTQGEIKFEPTCSLSKTFKKSLEGNLKWHKRINNLTMYLIN